MPVYRLYLLNLDNKIVVGIDHDCRNDQDAVALTHRIWASGERAEIWRGTKKLSFVAN